MADAFIKIGSTSIKRSNIKAFGISTEMVNEDDLMKPVRLLIGTGAGIYAKIKGGEFFSTFKEIFSAGKYRKYLYVTTYQSDNFRFYEDEVDISDGLKQLEQK